jgi:peptide chain release factor 2
MLTELKQELANFRQKVADLRGYLEIDEKMDKCKKLEILTQSTDFWKNQKEAKRVLQEVKNLKRTIEKWETIRDSIEDLGTYLEIANEEETQSLEKDFKNTKRELEALEVTALLSKQYDTSNAILSINAGAGGTDAQDWAQILLRMYSRWAESKEYHVEIPEISYGEEAGVKSATLVISGPYAYGYLKTENGIHRLVRISPFSSEGKRHTSFVSVETIPEISEEVEVEINPKDLRIDTYRASGPGGQHVNKTDSAVRITHIPTRIVAQSQSDRSQHANRDAAMKILKARLYELLSKQRKEKIEELRGEKRLIEWGSQIRSYVFHPYTMVKDHRTNTEVTQVQKVIDGDLDIFIEAALKKRI